MNLYEYQRSRSFIDLCPRSLRFNIFKLLFLKKNTRPIEAKFYIESPRDIGIKIYSNVPGHITKMASRPIYGKNLQKSPSTEPRGRWPWNLVSSIGYSSTTKFTQMMTLGWSWPFLWQGQICFIMLLMGESLYSIVMYFQGCSNSAYPVHSWAIQDQMVLWFLTYKTSFFSIVMNLFQVGQMQLLRKQIAHELNTLCKFDSDFLACSLQTMNK